MAEAPGSYEGAERRSVTRAEAARGLTRCATCRRVVVLVRDLFGRVLLLDRDDAEQHETKDGYELARHACQGRINGAKLGP